MEKCEEPSGRPNGGMWSALLGVVIFSGSLPATRVAVSFLDPVFLTFLRAGIAGSVAGMLLLLLRVRPPARREWAPLAVVAVGVVLGFPLLTAIALARMPSAQALIYIGVLPLATAAVAALRGHDRPSVSFWVAAAAGSAVVVIYGWSASLGHGAPAGHALMLAAVILCGIGYSEGARLSRMRTGWQTISWALVMSMPVAILGGMLTMPQLIGTPTAAQLLSIGYVSLFSMLIGFVFWYHGMARAGVAAASQLQLLQPFFGFALAALLLHERVTVGMLAAALLVAVCVVSARRFARNNRKEDHGEG